MSILETPAQPSAQHDDLEAITQLRDAFAAQRRAFAADRAPSLAERQARVGKIIPMLIFR